ncbi:hypothetical protein JRC04_05325 [Mycolicibacterium sp. S2-37]|uniref:hypothetical protein n=1 Tax=Mycolicibacterium sp. S2-37 TaxID=2810297 RepID=UPI001A93C46D|nr:hypothetical protein [Mycolicibacterium sp. S2-37]MBO0676876.1 hypothetical protein [Mycolicibacterium sp. S2-37]
MTHLDTLIADVSTAEAELARAQKALADAKKVEPYPVGTILRRRDCVVRRLDSLHSSAAKRYSSDGPRGREVSETTAPVWVSLFSDGSGSVYRSFAEVTQAYGPLGWEVIYNPGAGQ